MTTKLISTIAVAPRNLLITPRQSIYNPGDRIQCSAEGNPAPSYQWTDLDSGNVTQGAVLVVSQDMVNQGHIFRCTASNRYNGVNYTIADNIAFAVQGTSIVVIICLYVTMK